MRVAVHSVTHLHALYNNLRKSKDKIKIRERSERTYECKIIKYLFKNVFHCIT